MDYPTCLDCLLAERFWFLVAGALFFIVLSSIAMAKMRSPAKFWTTAGCVAISTVLIVLGSFQASAIADRDTYASRQPPWNSRAIPAETEIAEWHSYFDRTIEVAGRILQETRELESEWNEDERQHIESALHEVSCAQWIDLRLWTSKAGGNSAGPLEFAMLAESCTDGTTKICFYVDNILARLAKLRIDEVSETHRRDAKASFFANILVHELCHIDRAHGGFLSPPVPGEKQPQFPCSEHLGLWRWMAFVAHWKARDWLQSGEPALVWGAVASLRTTLRHLREPFADDLIRHCQGKLSVAAGPRNGWSPAGALPPDP
jgi:hypothetical protein